MDTVWISNFSIIINIHGVDSILSLTRRVPLAEDVPDVLVLHAEDVPLAEDVPSKYLCHFLHSCICRVREHMLHFTQLGIKWLTKEFNVPSCPKLSQVVDQRSHGL